MKEQYICGKINDIQMIKSKKVNNPSQQENNINIYIVKKYKKVKSSKYHMIVTYLLIDILVKNER